ncbi:MAG: hypothetical protein HY782_08120 [Chloroflexi bacterium]|nr:hypothetical protein [Chloroflexota bacterium]
MPKNSSRPHPPTRPEHSERYWAAAKYVILMLAALMFIALALAVIVLLRAVW